MTNRFQDPDITAAQSGDAAALDRVVRRVQTQIYRLAQRFLVNPDLAAEATQDILIRIVTKLSSFAGESRFETWVHRVAVNHLLTTRKLAQADPGLNFAAFSEDLMDGLVDDSAQAPEDHVMLGELRVSCTMAMLLCLDRAHRLAYVLGDILDFDHQEAAEILDVTPAAYRKRLSRARSDVVAFMLKTCGFANPEAPCRCRKRLPAALRSGRLPPNPSPNLADAPDMSDMPDVRHTANRREAEELVTRLQRATGALRPNKDIAADVMRLVAPPD